MPDNRKGFASALHIRGLRQRWMFSAVLPILLLLVLAVALFSVGVQEYYYNAMRSGLESRARIAAETFTGYGVKSYSEYYRLASYSAETFEEKDTIELQFINTNGRVQVSSYGLTAGTLPGTSDIDEAVGGEMAFYQGRDPQTGENVLAVSYPLYFNSRVVGVLRYVTSLREAQHRVLMDSLLASAAALVCMVLIAASNAIFINNVVEPVAVVSDAARRISGGSYGIMIENRYRDELGELVDNINDMSMKISQAEKIQQEFISSVSHELRTPLTAISGWAETLSVDPGSNLEQTKRGLGIILKESRRLTTMVEELLEFTKMQDGRFTLRVESVDLASELEDAHRRKRRARGKQFRYPRARLRPRHPGGGAAVREAEVLQGLVQGTRQRHRPCCVRRDRAPARRHVRHRERRRRRCSRDHRTADTVRRIERVLHF